jgi:copper chaperone NosL
MNRKKGYITVRLIILNLLTSLFFVLVVQGVTSNVTFATKAEESLRCAECGMTINQDSKFFSWAIDETGRKYFCDIGDFLYHYRKAPQKIKEAWVKDFITGEWIDARSAFYVKSGNFKTPMAWQIGAFKNKGDAERYGKALIFEEALELVR